MSPRFAASGRAPKNAGAVLTAANAVTVFRLMLFGAMVVLLWYGAAAWAVALFIAAWLLDIVDGFLARWLHQETRLGFMLDKIVDRLLIFWGTIFFITAAVLPPVALLILVKDIAALPLITIHHFAEEAIGSLGWPGKITTFLQGVAVLALWLEVPAAAWFVYVVALTGAAVAGRQIYRVVYTSEVDAR